MRKTQNDISKDSISIDYEALIKSVSFGYHEILEQMTIKLKRLQDEPYGVGAEMNLEWLEVASEKVLVMLETLNTLTEGLRRDEKKFVNIPE